MFLDRNWFLLQQHDFADGKMYETEHEEFEFECDDVVPDPRAYKLHPIRGVVWFNSTLNLVNTRFHSYSMKPDGTTKRESSAT